MAQFGQRLVIVSLCLLAAVIITEQRFPDNFSPDADMNDGVCIKYMGRYTVLDLQGVFNMVSQEYGLDMQDIDNIMWVEELFRRRDQNRDRYLNLRECTMFLWHMA